MWNKIVERSRQKAWHWLSLLAVLNINTATLEEFMVLANTSHKKAETIVAYRAAYGPFRSVDELLAIKGVGPKWLQKNQSQLMCE